MIMLLTVLSLAAPTPLPASALAELEAVRVETQQAAIPRELLGTWQHVETVLRRADGTTQTIPESPHLLRFLGGGLVEVRTATATGESLTTQQARIEADQLTFRRPREGRLEQVRYTFSVSDTRLVLTRGDEETTYQRPR